MPDKLHHYMSTECQLPLSKYEAGGVFSSYIQTDQLHQYATAQNETTRKQS